MTSLLPSTRRPDITFYHNGRIDISSNIAKQLNIHSGDVIDIMSDGGEYYLYVRLHAAVGRHEAQCFIANTVSRHTFRAYSVRLSRIMLSITNSTIKASLPCGVPSDQPFGKAIPIITKNKLL